MTLSGIERERRRLAVFWHMAGKPMAGSFHGLSERFAPYPLKVSLLNRFRTAGERKAIQEGLTEGTVDVVVGTHQLLGKGTSFKQLGLLVVDEEQRFGVNQKEKIKALRKDVDVLTLSATPIPRTLYMSLSGVREMSLITTPPPLRRPIKTHLAALDEEAVRSAIRQELDRGGQIFYVVPRVEGIEEVAEGLRQMIPGLRLLVAHGQMAEGELESAMVAFNAGEADLMLCTTIVESGLDIPRVNTILIEDAQKFGLAQLYQLRGRVGRAGQRAYAYLFHPSDAVLSETAYERLRTIGDHTELGSGFKKAKSTTRAERGHFAKASVEPKRKVAEFRVDERHGVGASWHRHPDLRRATERAAVEHDVVHRVERALGLGGVLAVLQTAFDGAARIGTRGACPEVALAIGREHEDLVRPEPFIVGPDLLSVGAELRRGRRGEDGGQCRRQPGRLPHHLYELTLAPAP